MIDSTNPRQLADNIRKLWDKFKSISGDLLPSRSTATTGQILKLTGENKTPAWSDEYSYTPPAYSETEVNTGRKWIDNKDIYCISKILDLPVISSSTSIDLLTGLSVDLVISMSTRIITPTGNTSSFTASNFTKSSGTVTCLNISSGYSEGKCVCIVYYTKPDPAPETRDDDTQEAPEEVKETKTRKKTTK